MSRLVYSQRKLDILTFGVVAVGLVLASDFEQLLVDISSSATLYSAAQRVVIPAWIIGIWLWTINCEYERYEHYAKVRNWSIALFRLLATTLPIGRDPAFIQPFLDIIPAPAPASILQRLGEIQRIALGSRQIMIAAAGIFLPVPFTMHIVLQFIALISTRDSQTVCTSTLVDNPIYGHYLNNIESVLDLSWKIFPSYRERTRLDTCMAVIGFSQILVGFMLPTLFLLKFSPPTVVLSAMTSKADQWFIRLGSLLCSPSENLRSREIPSARFSPDTRLRLIAWWFVWSLSWSISIALSY